MTRLLSALCLALLPLLAACASSAESAPPPGSPADTAANREAADRVLNTMKEKIAAADALVALRETNAQSLESALQAGRGTSAEVGTAQAATWEARIRALNYRQDLFMAEGAGPLVLETMRQKVAAAEKVLEIREEIVGDAQALIDAGREPPVDLASIRDQALEDRIRFLNFRLDLEYAQEVVRMTLDPGEGK